MKSGTLKDNPLFTFTIRFYHMVQIMKGIEIYTMLTLIPLLPILCICENVSGFSQTDKLGCPLYSHKFTVSFFIYTT